MNHYATPNLDPRLEAARERGRSDKAHRRWPVFRRAHPGYERLTSLLLGWVPVDSENLAEAAAYVAGYEERGKQ